jgi:hypothetical protein
MPTAGQAMALVTLPTYGNLRGPYRPRYGINHPTRTRCIIATSSSPTHPVSLPLPSLRDVGILSFCHVISSYSAHARTSRIPPHYPKPRCLNRRTQHINQRRRVMLNKARRTTMTTWGIYNSEVEEGEDQGKQRAASIGSTWSGSIGIDVAMWGGRAAPILASHQLP